MTLLCVYVTLKLKFSLLSSNFVYFVVVLMVMMMMIICDVFQMHYFLLLHSISKILKQKINNTKLEIILILTFSGSLLILVVLKSLAQSNKSHLQYCHSKQSCTLQSPLKSMSQGGCNS